MISLFCFGATMLSCAIGGAKGFFDNQKCVEYMEKQYWKLNCINESLEVENKSLEMELQHYKNRHNNDGTDNIIPFPSK